jgi:Lectin C-type domain
MDWSSASDHCKACKKNLVTFNTIEEAEYFMKATANESLWVGINDIEKTTNPRSFVQVNGVPFPTERFPWSTGEPNNDGNEHCVQSGYKGGYNDLPCIRVLKFACEEPTTIPPTTTTNPPSTTTTSRPTTTTIPPTTTTNPPSTTITSSSTTTTQTSSKIMFRQKTVKILNRFYFVLFQQQLSYQQQQFNLFVQI